MARWKSLNDGPPTHPGGGLRRGELHRGAGGLTGAVGYQTGLLGVKAGVL